MCFCSSVPKPTQFMAVCDGHRNSGPWVSLLGRLQAGVVGLESFVEHVCAAAGRCRGLGTVEPPSLLVRDACAFPHTAAAWAP